MSVCPHCDVEMDGEPLTCPKCGRHHHVLQPKTAELLITGQPIGMVVEGDPESAGGRRLDSHPASGGKSLSTIDENGVFEIVLSGALDAGHPSESHVMKVLIDKVKASGADVHRIAGEQDERGEDALLKIDDDVVPVQVTTIPTDIWDRLAKGEQVVLRGDTDAAVALIREAVERKSRSARGALLALDASHVGVIIRQKLLDAYACQFGNPCEEFGYRSVWIIGITSRSSIRLA